LSTHRTTQAAFLCGPFLFRSLCLIFFAISLIAQNQTVETHDAGGGNKQELVRDASGQVVETRTIDANGKVRSRNTNEYLPGNYVPNTTTTSYYADGKSVENHVTVTYDPSANFTSELAEQFDQAGKHVMGHKLLHDPVTGEFRCWKWNADKQDYQRIVCPSGEESGEKPPPLKSVSEADAIKMFQAARTAAKAEQKSERMVPKNLVLPEETPGQGKFAVVLPAAMIAGKQVSGSVVGDTHYIRLRPELVIQDITLPMPPGSNAAKLSGWRIEVAGSRPQRADAPFTFAVPQSGSQIEIKIYPDGQPEQAIARSVAIPKPPLQSGKPSTGYVAQVMCVIGDVCPIGGGFSGDATAALASFNDKPAKIVAETNDMAFIGVPDDLLYGPKQLLFNEGNELLAFPVVVAQIDVVVDSRHLDEFHSEVKQGDKKLVFAGLVGVQNLPDDDWKAGMFPKSNLEWARRFVPGFEVPRESHSEREEREMMEKLEAQQKGQKSAGKEKEEKLGTIVYFLKNTTTDVASWRGSKDQAFVLPLNPESFQQGDYRYKFVIQANKTGTYAMDAALIPFVAPSRGQKFTLPADVSSR